MTRYALAYRLGFTPWERYGAAAAASIGARLDREEAERSRPLGRALDLGCGRGQYTPELARRGWEVVGVDNVPRAIDEAKRRSVSGVTYVVGDVTDLEPADVGTFDLFFDVGCFQGLSSEGRLAEGRGVTALSNPGATLLMLVPPVVDLAGDTSVVAAGGIGDGRGIAAALSLGAHGASLGTRFLATTEMTIDQAWKKRIVAAHARDAVKVPHAERVLPPFNLPQVGVEFAPRALRTSLIEALTHHPEQVDPADMGPQLMEVIRAGGGHDELPFTGQSVELVHDIMPAAQLVERLWQECEAALALAATGRSLP